MQVNRCNNRGRSALYIAAKKGDLESVRLLLAMPNIDVTAREPWTSCAALPAAIVRGNFYVVSALLRHPDIDVQSADSYGFTPLHYAFKAEW